MGDFFKPDGAALTSNRDDWETPQALFDELAATYHFDLDPFSTHGNAKCERHFTVEDDGLEMDWGGCTFFANPPYGRDMARFIRKCAEESMRGARGVLLIPARTETRWAWEWVFPYASVRFIRGRLRYELGGVPQQSSPFPSMLCLYGLEDDMAVRIPT